MDDCCNVPDPGRPPAAGAFRRVLWVVLALNGAMFVVEFGAGWVADSAALMADSLDMLGDAAVYGLSLYALGRSARWRAGAALAKGLAMAAFGLFVLGDVGAKAWLGAVPAAPLMLRFALLALAANLVCAVLLVRFRGGEINMRSTWLCSRNDVLANLGVLGAGGLVALTGSPWPDLAAGLTIATLFLHSALGVVRQAAAELRVAPAPQGAPDPSRG